MYFSRIFYLFVIVSMIVPIGWAGYCATFFKFFFSLIPTLGMFVSRKLITFMCLDLLLGVFSMSAFPFYLHLPQEGGLPGGQNRMAQATSWTRGIEWTTGQVDVLSGGPFGPAALAQ